MAVVSMALVSCGGGKDEGVKPADPAFEYDGDGTVLDGCFQMKSVGVREDSPYKIVTSITVEVIKDIPFDKMKANNDDYYIWVFPHLLDKNMVKIGLGALTVNLKGKKKGDVFNISETIKTEEPYLTKEVKYARLGIGH